MKRRRVDHASDAVAARFHAVVDEQLEDALARDNGTGVRCLLGDHAGCTVGGWCSCGCHTELTGLRAQVEDQLSGPHATQATEEESPAA